MKSRVFTNILICVIAVCLLLTIAHVIYAAACPFVQTDFHHLLVVVLFAGFNLSVYMLLTNRLLNNFSGTTQSKMIDFRKYLPHEEGSELARISSSLKLTANQPALDGAAAPSAEQSSMPRSRVLN